MSSTPNNLPTRTALHLARKFFHFLTGYAFALANLNLPSNVWNTLASLQFLFVFCVEVVRIRFPNGRLNKSIRQLARPFMRSHETHQFSGMMYYTAGVAIVSILFSKTSASIGIMCLACLDPIAALIGSLMQPHLPEARLRNGKSIAGFVFANTTAILVVTLILSQAIQTTMVTTHMFMASVLIAWAGALTELVIPSPQIILGNTSFPIGIDDNVFIPIVCAAVCELVLWLTMDTVILSPILFWDKIW